MICPCCGKPKKPEIPVGLGTSLKPAAEFAAILRKPLSEGTVAANVLRHGTGALNIDACRVAADKPIQAHHGTGGGAGRTTGSWADNYTSGDCGKIVQTQGRWPANVCHSGEPEVMDAFARFGERKDSGFVDPSPRSAKSTEVYGAFAGAGTPFCYGDNGSAARFFYTAKAGADERLDSKHPTQKPVNLLKWLVGLVTPPGGKVLDPFAGTGTTLVACDQLGFDALGIEMSSEYVEDAKRKIEIFRARRFIGRDVKQQPPDPAQRSLFDGG